jgi:hypothetical protein
MSGVPYRPSGTARCWRSKRLPVVADPHLRRIRRCPANTRPDDCHSRVPEPKKGVRLLRQYRLGMIGRRQTRVGSRRRN